MSREGLRDADLLAASHIHAAASIDPTYVEFLLSSTFGGLLLASISWSLCVCFLTKNCICRAWFLSLRTSSFNRSWRSFSWAASSFSVSTVCRRSFSRMGRHVLCPTFQQGFAVAGGQRRKNMASCALMHSWCKCSLKTPLQRLVAFLLLRLLPPCVHSIYSSQMSWFTKESCLHCITASSTSSSDDIGCGSQAILSCTA